MKDFFPWGLRIGSPRRWNISRMEMKFEFVDSRVFLGRVFRLIFRSRGSEIVDEVLSCSVRFFLFFFFIYKQRCCNNWDNWDECREIFPWINMADLKFKFQRLIKDDFFFLLGFWRLDLCLYFIFILCNRFDIFVNFD